MPVLTGNVGPGDLIYIPRGWWHAVRAHQESISVNYFFGENMGAIRRLKYAFSSGIMSWLAIIRDFFKHGVLGVSLPGRLYSSEPFGVWFYNEIIGFLRRRNPFLKK